MRSSIPRQRPKNRRASQPSGQRLMIGCFKSIAPKTQLHATAYSVHYAHRTICFNGRAYRTAYMAYGHSRSQLSHKSAHMKVHGRDMTSRQRASQSVSGLMRQRLTTVYNRFCSTKPNASVKKAGEQTDRSKRTSFFAGIPKTLSPETKRMVSFAGVAQKELVFGILCLPGALLATMAVPWIVGKVIDLVSSSLSEDNGRLLTEEARDQIYRYVLILFGLSLFGSVATFFRSYFMNLSSELIVKHLRLKLFGHLARNKPMQFFDSSTTRTGDLVNRLSADSTIISNVLTESVSMGLRSVATLVFGIGFLFYTSKNLALVSCSAVLPLLLTAKIYGSFIKKETNKQLTEFGASSAIAEESLSFIRVISIFNQQQLFINKYDSKLTEVLETGKRICWYRGMFFGGTELIVNLSLLSVVGYGSYLVFSKVISPGELTSFLMYSLYVTGANFQLTAVYSAIMRALGANQRIMEVWPVEEGKDSSVGESEAKPKGSVGFLTGSQLPLSVTFENVSFTYPTRSDDSPVLQGLDLTVPGGKSVAVVGRSGSGKSTIINLLCKLYSPDQGRICIAVPDESKEGSSLSSMNIADLDRALIRDNIGVVTQEPVIFMASILDNIRLGRTDADMEEVIAAAKMANIHGFIKTMSDGYDTVVGERGSQLSGGQKQRLCIARAILKDPAILILDEATSSLDVENEYLVQKALENVMQKRTSIIITHRLSTLRNVDYIAVLDKGRVVQYGEREAIVNDREGVFQTFLNKNSIS